MKKKILLVTIIAFSFLLLGCEKKEEPLPEPPSVVEEKNLHSDSEKLVFDMGNVMHLFYYNNENKITNHVAYLMYGSSDAAKEDIEKYQKDYKEVKQEDNYLILTYNPSEYQNETIDSIRAMYSLYEVTE